MTDLPAPIRAILDLFSSVRLGITLLLLIFVYSWLGSAGILYPIERNLFDVDSWDIIWVRQWRGLEMTEFEWFHWWPFNLLIALLCINLTVTTLRRIPFNVINLGVWMIHSGIIILALGSVWYFSMKVEGDTPVLRREVRIEVPGAAATATTMAALPGNRAIVIAGGEPYRFEILDVDPEWEILSGDDAGRRAFAVSLRITTPQQTFVRHLIDRHPQYTEDVIPGEGRAVQVRGTRLIDDSLDIALAPAVQRHFYLMHTDALYLREVGQSEWIERPIRGLPRYNEYLAEPGEVWLPSSMRPGGRRPLQSRALRVPVPPASEADPMAGMTFRIAGYLPYAVEQPRMEPGGDRLNPYLRFRVAMPQGQPEFIEMMAFNPAFSSVDRSIAVFHWIEDESELESWRETRPGRILVRVPDHGFQAEYSAFDLDFDDPQFIELNGSGYEIRIRDLADDFEVPGIANVSFVNVDVRSPGRAFNRWVFDDPSRNRDQVIDPESGEIRPVETDPGIEIEYVPSYLPSALTFIGGPDPSQIRLLLFSDWSQRSTVIELQPGRTETLAQDVSLTLERFWPFTREVMRPFVIPESQRQQGLSMRLRMIQVHLPGRDGEAVPIWLPFQDYPFAGEHEVMRGFMHQPRTVTLSDGREIEMVYSRRRSPLPSPVILDDFVVDWHVGGYTGANTSVRNWTSVVRFFDESDRLGEPQYVAVNSPGSHEGMWFFQSMWDAPDTSGSAGLPPSRGMAFTVLGVGNRRGVHVQLFGCTLAVVGMIYAFYIKPSLRRRRQSKIREAALARRQPIPQDGDSEDAKPRNSDVRPPNSAREEVSR